MNLEELNKYLYLRQCQFVTAYLSSLSPLQKVNQRVDDEGGVERAKVIYLNALSICSRVEYAIQQEEDINLLYPPAIIDLHRYYMVIMPDSILFLARALKLLTQESDVSVIISLLKQQRQRI